MCLPFHQASFKMAQFDLMITFNVIWVLSLTLIAYYVFLIDFLMPTFFGQKKFKFKKLKG
jgi:hypothetical protein